MKDLWRGIAIAGIWIGVGLLAMFAGPQVIIIAFCAMIATIACVD